MTLEAQVLQIDNTIVPSNGEVNGRVRLVTDTGASLPASALPPLPTSNGQYGLQVTGGVYTWTAVT